jgi:hypothetical protein
LFLCSGNATVFSPDPLHSTVDAASSNTSQTSIEAAVLKLGAVPRLAGWPIGRVGGADVSSGLRRVSGSEFEVQGSGMEWVVQRPPINNPKEEPLRQHKQKVLEGAMLFHAQHVSRCVHAFRTFLLSLIVRYSQRSLLLIKSRGCPLFQSYNTTNHQTIDYPSPTLAVTRATPLSLAFL